MKVDRFTKICRPAQLHRAGHPPRLGRLGRQFGCQSSQLRHPHDRSAVAPLPRAVAGGDSLEPDHRLGMARPVSQNAGPQRLLPHGSALPPLLRVRSGGERQRHGVGNSLAAVLDGGDGRAGPHGAAGGDLDEPHDQAAGAVAVEGSAPAGVHRGGGWGPALLHARQGRRQPADSRSPRVLGRALALPSGRSLLAAADGRPEVSGPLRPPRRLRGRNPGPGNCGSPRCSTRPPRFERSASRRPPGPVFRSTSCQAST